MYVTAQFGDDFNGDATISHGLIYDLKFDFPTQILQMSLVGIDAVSNVLLVLGDETTPTPPKDNNSKPNMMMMMTAAPMMPNGVQSTPMAAATTMQSMTTANGVGDMSNVVAITQLVSDLSEQTRVGYRRYTLRGDQPFGIASLVIVQTEHGKLSDTTLTDVMAPQIYSITASQPVFIAVACVAVLLSCICGCLVAFLVIRCVLVYYCYYFAF